MAGLLTSTKFPFLKGSIDLDTIEDFESLAKSM